MKNSNDKTSILTQIAPTRLELVGSRAHLTIGPCSRDSLRAIVAGARRFAIYRTPECWIVLKRAASNACGSILGVEVKDVTGSSPAQSIQSLALWHQPSVGSRRKLCERPAKFLTSVTKSEAALDQLDNTLNYRLGFEFTRQEVERLDFTRFFKLFGPAELPTGPKLAALHGKLTVAVDGYQNDPRELWEIPEVRRFYQAWWKAWPFAPFFADLTTMGLFAIVMCCLDSVRVMKRDGNDFCSTDFDTGEMWRWIDQNGDSIAWLDFRAGFSPKESVSHLFAVTAYLTQPCPPVAPS